jgi:hypothetical protein
MMKNQVKQIDLITIVIFELIYNKFFETKKISLTKGARKKRKLLE